MDACGYTFWRKIRDFDYPADDPNSDYQVIETFADQELIECLNEGEHFCTPRADKAQAFFEEILVHTKGTYSRKKFILEDWQRDDIIRPLFGNTTYSEEYECYKRQYEIAWIEVGRKNGKTELLAGVMLYLLVSDGEESAEIYGVARDRKQAALAFDVAAQMVKFSPILSKRLKITQYKKRIFDVKTNSFYEVIAADAASALGSNPSGVGADEILAWQDGGMWDSMRTGMGSGARLQPLMVASTTAGNDTEGFAGLMHKEMQKIADEPERSKHTFVYMRNTPMDADPWAEENWPAANPALGRFLSWEAMRRQAEEARQNPIAEMGFRQFRLNQWQNSTVRWMNMYLWDKPDNQGIHFGNGLDTLNHFAGRQCWFGLDLAARQDLCSMCYLFPDPDDPEVVDVAWRFWIPETGLDKLNRLNNDRFNQFVRDQYLTVTEGDVLDFQQVYADVQADALRFTILGGDADKWSSDPVIQEIESKTYVREIFSYSNDFSHMSDSMHRIFEMVTEGRFRHHGNPLARFCFDAAEAKVAPYDPNLIRPVKPDRITAAKRIDAVPAAVMAVNAWHTRGYNQASIYETQEVLAL